MGGQRAAPPVGKGGGGGGGAGKKAGLLPKPPAALTSWCRWRPLRTRPLQRRGRRIAVASGTHWRAAGGAAAGRRPLPVPAALKIPHGSLSAPPSDSLALSYLVLAAECEQAAAVHGEAHPARRGLEARALPGTLNRPRTPPRAHLGAAAAQEATSNAEATANRALAGAGTIATDQAVAAGRSGTALTERQAESKRQLGDTGTCAVLHAAGHRNGRMRAPHSRLQLLWAVDPERHVECPQWVGRACKASWRPGLECVR